MSLAKQALETLGQARSRGAWLAREDVTMACSALLALARSFQDELLAKAEADSQATTADREIHCVPVGEWTPSYSGWSQK